MHTIYITAEDNTRLRVLLLLLPYSADRRRDAVYLRHELDRAVLCTPSDRPLTIQIGTTFEFMDLQSGETGTHTLCLPDEIQQTANGLSVLSRFGAAVLGCSLGDEVTWSTAAARRRILIHAIVRPTGAPKGGRSRSSRTGTQEHHDQSASGSWLIAPDN